jgi:hypothetical protein
MIRGLYHNVAQKQRLLTADEVARACSISTGKVEKWLAQNILRSTKGDREYVDVMDLLWFLLRNNMPVAPSLLPARSIKVLFLALTSEELYENEGLADQICRILSESCSLVLAESTIMGRLAYLSILTNKPDLAIIFQKRFELASSETLQVLGDIPGLKVVFCGDVATKLALEHSFIDCRPSISFSRNISESRLREKLSTLLAM